MSEIAAVGSDWKVAVAAAAVVERAASSSLLGSMAISEGGGREKEKERKKERMKEGREFQQRTHACVNERVQRPSQKRVTLQVLLSFRSLRATFQTKRVILLQCSCQRMPGFFKAAVCYAECCY
jgi:hypothetical protein